MEDTGADRLTLTECDQPFPMDKARLLATHSLMKVWACEDGGWLYEDVNGRAALLEAADGRSAACWLADPAQRETVLPPLLQALLECRLIHRGYGVLHCACVVKDGKAVAFSGPSGTGKSTRARQWAEALLAQWLSGDRPFIDPGQGVAYGAPWDGKEQIFRNAAYPLAAIFEVRRADKTALREMTFRQKRSFLANQLLIPLWNPRLGASALAAMNRMIARIPMYRLYCDQSSSAAQEAYEILFHRQGEIQPPREEKMMRAKQGFTIVEMAGDYMAMPTGSNMATFGGTVALNKVSAFLLQAMQTDISREDLLERMLNQYEVDRETAERDLEEILAAFRKLGLIED
ncbi:MAG: PqqD family peptide modification chaperone [Aristaeellaceae bacterium]